MELTANGVHVLISNSDITETRKLYAKMRVQHLQVGRTISAAAASRTAVGEVLATSYPTLKRLAKPEQLMLSPLPDE